MDIKLNIMSPEIYADAPIELVRAAILETTRPLGQHFPDRSETINIHYAPPYNWYRQQPSDPIRIDILSQAGYFQDHAYYIGHELCHVLCNSEVRRLRAQTWSVWLEESFCEAGSLYTLDAMSEQWRYSDVPHYRQFVEANGFKMRLEELMNQSHRVLPEGKSMPEWYRDNRIALEANDLDNDVEAKERHNLIGLRIYLLLHELGWHHWTAIETMNNDAGDMSEYLAAWKQKLGAEHHVLVDRLYELFEIETK